MTSIDHPRNGSFFFYWVHPATMSIGYSYVIPKLLWHQWQLYSQQSLNSFVINLKCQVKVTLEEYIETSLDMQCVCIWCVCPCECPYSSIISWAFTSMFSITLLLCKINPMGIKHWSIVQRNAIRFDRGHTTWATNCFFPWEMSD